MNNIQLPRLQAAASRAWLLAGLLALAFAVQASPLLASEEPEALRGRPRFAASYLDSLAIELEPGSGRPYLFSGTGTGFFYGSTASLAGDGHMGLHMGPWTLWHDFIVTVNGAPLDRAEARVSVRPHAVSFRWEGGQVLTVTALGKEQDDLRLSFSGAEPDAMLGLFLVMPDGRDVHVGEDMVVRNGRQMIRQIAGSDTFGLALCSEAWFRAAEIRPALSSNSRIAGSSFLAGKSIHGALFEGDRFRVSLLHGRDPETIIKRWETMRTDQHAAAEARRDWLLDVLNQGYFRSDNERMNRAYHWAQLSLAQLWAEDESLIWAGLPWFNDGWARDTFISLPGAALVQGRFTEAAKVIRRFAQWQNRDGTSEDDGKVPNRARFGELIYNTADGTPWFLREIREYVLYSGDWGLASEMLSPGGVVESALSGALDKRVGPDGLLRHGPADTWMDAKGPDGAWSPRGDRAVEVQALWIEALEASVELELELARREGRRPRAVINRWQEAAARARSSFAARFVRADGRGLFDHLNEDGSPDSSVRPNQLFALTVPNGKPLVEPGMARRVAESVKGSCVYPWGVASLAQSDPAFHPWHETSHYPKDAAYHMGIVWTWLSGPFKSADPASGWVIARHEIDRILERGAVGSLEELMDALPHEPGEPVRLSGTVSQAWSLAEFIRSWQQDYLGLRPMAGQPGRWSWQPALPREWGNVTALLPMKGQLLRLDIEHETARVRVRFEQVAGEDSVEIVPFGKQFAAGGDWSPQPLRLTGEGSLARLDLRRLSGERVALPGKEGAKAYVPLLLPEPLPEGFVEPRLPEGLSALAPPPWPQLPGALAGARPSPAAVLRIHASDPIGDDAGPGGGFSYPSAPVFAEGILDITGLELRSDEALAYITLRFRRLTDPGWHDNYGFQLTTATLAIHTGVPGRERTRQIGRNANHLLPRYQAADRLLHVGGGWRLEDAAGEVLAEHLPDNPRYAIGDVAAGELRLSLPLEYLGGDPAQWRVTVAVGAQDDHGGAGLGSFRAVLRERGPWHGGGGKQGESNVYDLLEMEP